MRELLHVCPMVYAIQFHHIAVWSYGTFVVCTFDMLSLSCCVKIIFVYLSAIQHEACDAEEHSADCVEVIGI